MTFRLLDARYHTGQTIRETTKAEESYETRIYHQRKRDKESLIEVTRGHSASDLARKLI